MEWGQYRCKIRESFPYVYDNKYLFASSPILNNLALDKQTGLENCFLGMRALEKHEHSEP